VIDAPRTSSGLTAGVTLPLFDGGARRADRNAAKDSVEAARLRDMQLAKDITASIDSAWASAASARDRIAAARALEESATVNLQAAQEKYKQGLGIALEVTTAQLQLFNAQISSIGALYDYHQARAALDRATGRWSGLK
jgi:outer membrane protein